MSSESAAGGRSSGRMIAVVVLVIIAVLAIIAGIMYFAEPAKSLPSRHPGPMRTVPCAARPPWS